MSQNVNMGRFLCQYSSQVQYTDPSRYSFSDRQIPDGYWNTSYLVLRDLTEVRGLLDAYPAGSDDFNLQIGNQEGHRGCDGSVMYQNLVDLLWRCALL